MFIGSETVGKWYPYVHWFRDNGKWCSLVQRLGGDILNVHWFRDNRKWYPYVHWFRDNGKWYPYVHWFRDWEVIFLNWFRDNRKWYPYVHWFRDNRKWYPYVHWFRDNGKWYPCVHWLRQWEVISLSSLVQRQWEQVGSSSLVPVKSKLTKDLFITHIIFPLSLIMQITNKWPQVFSRAFHLRFQSFAKLTSPKRLPNL